MLHSLIYIYPRLRMSSRVLLYRWRVAFSVTTAVLRLSLGSRFVRKRLRLDWYAGSYAAAAFAPPFY